MLELHSTTTQDGVIIDTRAKWMWRKYGAYVLYYIH